MRAVLFCLVGLLFTSLGYAQISLPAIAEIESSNNPLAVNKHSGAIGLYQIMPTKHGALADYNLYHKVKITKEQLFIPSYNEAVAKFLLNKRATQFINHFDLPNTNKTRLIIYNAGIKHAIDHYKKGKRLYPETKNYIMKYNQIINRGERK